MRCTFTRLEPAEVPWEELDRRAGRSVFCTRAWLEFLTDSQHAEPVVARIDLDGIPVGWFTGAIVRRGGLRILGSPLPGWTTSYMGFDLDEVDGLDTATVRLLALVGLRRFAFGPLRCAHLEVLDRALPPSATMPPRMELSVFHSYERPLDDDDTMLAAMSQNARRNLRRGTRRGLTVEEVPVGDGDRFARAYYAQVGQAFARQGLTPTYPLERVRQMIERVHPTGNLVLVRAVAPDGRCAATGIFPGLAESTAVFWMGAGDPELLDLRPNEAVMWHGMRAWRDRGATTFDMGGGGTYKEKFGVRPVESAWVRSSRFAALERARTVVRDQARRRQRRDRHA